MTGRSIAVLRALQLGDLLVAIPAIRALKLREPESRLTLIGLPWAEQLVGRYPRYLDDFIAFPGWPGIAEREPDEERLVTFQREASARRFDLAVQMHGDGGVTNGFLATIPAARYAGFAPDKASCGPDPMGAGFIPYPHGLPEVQRLLRLSEALGATDLDATLEFPVFQEERIEAAAILAAAGVEAGAPYACMHAGGRGADRRWPVEGFARIADALVASGFVVVLTGSEVDREVNARVCALVRERVIDLTGRTSIGTLAAVIERAALVVTNDSAPSHLAAALRVPSVVIYTGSDRARWAPSDGRLHRGVGAGRPDGGPPAPPPPLADVLAALPAGPRSRFPGEALRAERAGRLSARQQLHG